MSSLPARPPNTQFGSSSSVDSYSTSDSDASSGSSARPGMNTVTQPVASVEVLRCLRCARAVEVTTTDDPGSSGMVRIGTNIYYCERCAKTVGYK